MSAMVSTLYTASLTLCLLGTGLLRGRRTAGRTGLSWLSWFLVVESAAFAFELLMAHPHAPLKALWLALRLGGSLFIAPCLWLAVRESVEGGRPRFRELGDGFLGAIGIGVVLTVPLLADAHWGVTYANPQAPASWLHSKLIHTTMLGCIGIFAVQVPLLLWRCRRLLAARAAESEQRWLQWPLLVVATTWALGLLRTLQCAAHASQGLTLVFALTEVGVTVGAIYVLLRRLATAPEQDDAEAAPAPSPVTTGEGKYLRSSLTPAMRQRIAGKLLAALATEAVHGDSLLSLRSLCRQLNEKAHYVSQVINQDLGTNFYDLVNRHRIERAKHLLVAETDQTVLAVALAVGFNSKSTFNTAFRRHTGTTPTEYRAQRGTG